MKKQNAYIISGLRAGDSKHSSNKSNQNKVRENDPKLASKFGDNKEMTEVSPAMSANSTDRLAESSLDNNYNSGYVKSGNFDNYPDNDVRFRKQSSNAHGDISQVRFCQ